MMCKMCKAGCSITTSLHNIIVQQAEITPSSILFTMCSSPNWWNLFCSLGEGVGEKEGGNVMFGYYFKHKALLHLSVTHTDY